MPPREIPPRMIAVIDEPIRAAHHWHSVTDSIDARTIGNRR